MRAQSVATLSLNIVLSAFGQTYTISTIAGDTPPLNVLGTSASLGPYAPQYIAADAAGNLFFIGQTTILRLDAGSGVLTLVAGNGTIGFSGDGGPATSAQLDIPRGLAVDSAGNLYIADSQNYRIREVSNGVISTIAGTGAGFFGDNGPAINAGLYQPTNVTVDMSGDLYFVDTGVRVREISNGVITTVAGNGTPGFSGDNGAATSAQLSPAGLAVDSSGNLYIADSQDNRIRKVSNGVITTVAGNGTRGFSGDGPATSAQLYNPTSLAVDSSGNLYIADTQNNRIRKVSNGVITTVAGNGAAGFGGDGGSAIGAQLNNPMGLAVDADNLYIADSDNYRIRRVSNGVITTVAGGGPPLGDNGPAVNAQLGGPSGVAADAVGDLYIADSGDNRIREISSGVITTVAGNGTPGFSGDGSAATSAQLNTPAGVAVDSSGSLYIVDTPNKRIRKVSNGVITTVAGGGNAYPGDDGPAANAIFIVPAGVAVDAAGDLYIADSGDDRVRKVSNGVITAVAGCGTFCLGLNNECCFSGDNGVATRAQLLSPIGLAVDSFGNLYIADSGNNRIRKVSNGVITTVAGKGTLGFSGDNGPAADAQLAGPFGVAVDSAGNLYIADEGNFRICKVSGGVITTVAGNADAQLAGPLGVAVDSAGNVYVADTGNNRVRLLTPSGPSCSYSVSPTSLAVPASGGSLSVTIQTTPSCSWAVSGLPDGIVLSGASLGAGPTTATLVAAPNRSTMPLNATVSIAGVSVAITQPAGCTFSINPGGQAFPATGGSGAISVTATAGCPWSATSNLTWVTFTSAITASGNGTLSYQVAANSTGDRSGTLTIAGLSFVVEQAAGSIADLTSAGSMAQLVFGGAWTTTFTFVNTASSAVRARFSFFDNNGNPLLIPLVFPQLDPSGTPIWAAVLDRIVSPGAALVIQTAPSPGQQTLVGWAQVLASGNLGGFAVFQQSVGTSLQEAVVPFENRKPNALEIWFDNTGGYSTGIALANTSPQPATVPVIIRDDNGLALQYTSIALPALGHTSFNLGPTYALTAGRRGTLEFDVPTGGGISVLGLRFNPTGAFTTIPALAK